MVLISFDLYESLEIRHWGQLIWKQRQPLKSVIPFPAYPLGHNLQILMKGHAGWELVIPVTQSPSSGVLLSVLRGADCQTIGSRKTGSFLTGPHRTPLHLLRGGGGMFQGLRCVLCLGCCREASGGSWGGGHLKRIRAVTWRLGGSIVTVKGQAMINDVPLLISPAEY